MPSLWRTMQHLRHLSHGSSAGTAPLLHSPSPTPGKTPPAAKQQNITSQFLRVPTTSPQGQPCMTSPLPEQLRSLGVHTLGLRETQL